jgi:acetyltransferase-like isoleucine patch superfamily enzyme
MEGNNRNVFIHSTSIVESCEIGDNTKVWQFSVILDGAKIGKNCNINFSCFVENGVILGDNVTVKSGIYLWDGIECEDNVFLGPNVVFTNDIFPRSKNYKPIVKTLIKKGASIGANSTILAGVSIGKYAMTGIASVVTRDIPDYALFYGNPAKFKCWIDELGCKLDQIGPKQFLSTLTGKRYFLEEGNLIPELIN